MRAAMWTFVIVSAGCFSPKLTNFGFTCDSSQPKPCPDGYVCRGGYCDNGSGGQPPPGGTGGNGAGDMAMSQGGGGGGGGGGKGGGGGNGGGGDMAMSTPNDFAMPAPADMAQPAPPDLAKPPADMAQTSSCAHDECTSGTKLTNGCSACVTAVCGQDPYCCSSQWDSFCVADVNMYCTTKHC